MHAVRAMQGGTGPHAAHHLDLRWFARRWRWRRAAGRTDGRTAAASFPYGVPPAAPLSSWVLVFLALFLRRCPRGCAICISSIFPPFMLEEPHLKLREVCGNLFY